MRIDPSKHKQTICIMNAKQFDEWKNGKLLIRKTDGFDQCVNQLENTVSYQISFDVETDANAAKSFNEEVIRSMFETEYAERKIKEYNRGEYAANLKYNDGMYVTYEEFVKTLHHYGTEAYAHKLSKTNEVLLIYFIK